MVYSWNIQVFDIFRDYSRQIFALDCRDNCADFILYVGKVVLLRVTGLDAASMLLMNMPPLPDLGSIMHWMSS